MAAFALQASAWARTVLKQQYARASGAPHDASFDVDRPFQSELRAAGGPLPRAMDHADKLALRYLNAIDAATAAIVRLRATLERASTSLKVPMGPLRTRLRRALDTRTATLRVLAQLA